MLPCEFNGQGITLQYTSPQLAGIGRNASCALGDLLTFLHLHVGLLDIYMAVH